MLLHIVVVVVDNNKESATKTTETKTKTDRTTHSMYQPTMTVDDEVKTLARRSKMVVLRAAMTGTGTTSSGMNTVAFLFCLSHKTILLRISQCICSLIPFPIVIALTNFEVSWLARGWIATHVLTCTYCLEQRCCQQQWSSTTTS